MDSKQVNEALEKLFRTERIVFWNDPDREFVDYLDGGLFSPVEGVSVIQLDQTSALEAKLRMEHDEPTGKFLLYSSREEPNFDDDWLLDIRLFSRSFRADKATIISDELGLQARHMREHLAKRRKFCDKKERLQKLKSLVNPDDSEDEIDRKMLAVTVKADQPELFNILRTLVHYYAEEDEVDLRANLPVMDQIEKFDLAEPFWRFIKRSFGYVEESPSLENLMVRLFVTDFAQSLHGEGSNLEHLILPPSGRSNAVVCLAQWRDSASKGSGYDRVSEYVSRRINLESQLHSFEIDHLIDIQTFLAVENEIARNLKERVLSTADAINVSNIRDIAGRRQAGHWASSTVQGHTDVPRKELNAVYEALVTAAEFFNLKNIYRDGFEFNNASEMYAAYESKLYRFDQFYRHFCEYADICTNWNIVKPLREQVEAAYSNWFINGLGISWGKFLDDGLLENWKISQVYNEYDFFMRHVEPRLLEREHRRAYVIISDAFRYEAAQELTQELNGKYRFTATITSQLSVLPSYTALGMASLLPHKKLEYDSKGNVLVDGKACGSLEQRNEILSVVDGVALRSDDLLKMKKEEGRDAVAGKKIVYIYHDEIDSRGDKASTEVDTFDAVRKAINELGDLVRFIINSLNGNYVVVTADHGFLFSESKPDETQKSKLDHEPAGTVLAKKRYLLGRNLPEVDEAYHGSVKKSAKVVDDMEFWLPKAANRFHFTGGSRFIHGGAMLQEVVVPVITVRHVRGKGKQETVTRNVGVQVLGVNHRITTPRYRFSILQTEPVKERVKPITLKAGIYLGNELVTNLEKVVFDSTSESMDERTRQVILVLQDRQYDKKNKYRLVLRDVETDIEQSNVEVIIDRAFTDDF